MTAMLSTSLVVQCFVKLDTLVGLCESLLMCDGCDELDLIFWCDSPIGSRLEERYTLLAAGVRTYLNEFLAHNSHQFRSIEVKENSINQGTCKTCELSMTYALSRNPFAIFVEDDVLFSRDALIWFKSVLHQGMLSDDRNWAIAGESVFFNAQNRVLPIGWKERMLEVCIASRLLEKYVFHSFIPSTCFATTTDKWREFGETRGLPLGDEDVCKRCANEGKRCVFPVLPRVKDVGMLHDDGYSVLIHTKEGVREIKNTYLMSDDLLTDSASWEFEFAELQTGVGELYTQSTKLTE